ncbi:putative calcium-binding protein CML20 [Folsomia candida]|uniref:Putative calcium-binding protein CML20 n=1 Tax=Folsomia candida TaxID=158441 RepID=A0A226EA84_FOLCA|nr:putative calcium-binding protein CML20 [Folsomia candida]
MAKNRKYERCEVEAAYQKMPTYNKKHKSINITDPEAFQQAIGFIYTEEQFNAYARYFGEHHDGMMTQDLMAASFGAVDDAEELMKIHILAVDKDKNGLIDESEFKSLLSTLLTHNPNFPRVDFDKFVEEADTNRDGVVSIDEAVAWFVNQAKEFEREI